VRVKTSKGGKLIECMVIEGSFEAASTAGHSKQFLMLLALRKNPSPLSAIFRSSGHITAGMRVHFIFFDHAEVEDDCGRRWMASKGCKEIPAHMQSARLHTSSLTH